MPVKRLRTKTGLVAAIVGAFLLLAACATAPEEFVLGPETVIGFVVADADTGAILAERKSNRAFIPASTAKLPTMIAALELLGPDYRFHTDVLATGTPDANGVLRGDLILRGGGDPLISPQDILGLVSRLKDLGLRQVTGRFLYDDRLLPALPAINPDQPAEARYNPGVNALSMDFNRWRLTWETDPKTGTRRIHRLPPLDVHGVNISQQSGGPGRDVLWRDGGWHLSADAGETGDRFLPVKNPALATTQLFRRFAGQLGLELPPPQASATPENAKRAARLTSLPLAEIVRLGLQHSNNLVSELIGLTAYRLAVDRPMSLAASASGLSAWLHRAIAEAGIKDGDWSNWKMDNHSGLSPRSRLTPRQMVSLLRFAHGRRYGAWPFTSFLPAAGFRRAFRDRYLNRWANGRVWAKTGSLNYAKGLAGFMHGRDGRALVFGLYITDPPLRQAYDLLAEKSPALRDNPEVRARALLWTAAAEAMEERLVLDWLDRF